MNSNTRRQVSVIGAGVCDEELAGLAEAVGSGLAQAGVRIVCGGMGGVMEAAARGASEAGGEVIGIVPGESPSDANQYCTHVVATGIGHARNLAVVASGEVAIAIGGEWGTLAEIGLARRLGRPVIALESWSLRGRGRMSEAEGIEPADSPEAAVAKALELLATSD